MQMRISSGCYTHTCFIRQSFAHEAVLAMEPDADARAPGANTRDFSGLRGDGWR